MNYQDKVEQDKVAAEQWLVENADKLDDVVCKETQVFEHNITFDSEMQRIALEEADSLDTWESGDTSQTWIESVGNQDVTGLAHWQGEREESESQTNRGLFIQEKFEKFNAKHSKRRAFHNIEFCLDKAGRIRKSLPSASIAKEAKTKRIESKLRKLDATADNRPYRKPMKLRAARFAKYQ